MLKVASLNIFWNNGSYEVPTKHPPLDRFVDKPNANLCLYTKETGYVVLEGNWNYAYIDNLDSYYFLERIKTLDIEKDVHKYTLIRDLSYELYKLEDLVIYGELNRVSDSDVIRENLQMVSPLIDNPVNIELVNVPQKDSKNKIRVSYDENKSKKIAEYFTIVANSTWNSFVNQYNDIPDKTTTKTKPAILACLTTEKTASWKWVLLSQYLRPWMIKLAKNFKTATLVQSTEKSRLNGRYQLTLDAKLYGANKSNMSILKSLTVEIEEVEPLSFDTLQYLYNQTVDSYNTEGKTKPNKRGYFQGANFYEDSKPWENKSPTSAATVAPFDDEDYGIDETLELHRLAKSDDQLVKVEIDGLITVDFLKSKRTQLDQIHDLIKKVGKNQDGYLNNIYEHYTVVTEGRNRGLNFYLHQQRQYIYGTYYVGDFSSSNMLYNGLPTKDNEYDYNEIMNMINGEIYTNWDSSFTNTFYYFIAGTYIVGFGTAAERDRVVSLIRDLKHSVPRINPTIHKRAILSAIYKHSGRRVTGFKYFDIHPENLAKGRHLFDLVGTNYYLTLDEGKVSLYFKDITKDTRESYLETYELEDTAPIDNLSEVINTKLILNIYGKDYAINEKRKVIKDLKVLLTTPKFKFTPFDHLYIDYQTDYTRIWEINTIAKEAVGEISQFNAVEYIDSLIKRDRDKEDYEMKWMEIDLERNKQDFDMSMKWEAYNLEYAQNITDSCVGIFTSVASGVIGALSGGIAGGMLINSALNVGSQISGTVFNAMKLNMKHKQLQEEEKQILASRALENYKLDVNIHRLADDNKRNISRLVNMKEMSSVNDRDLFNEMKQVWNVGNVFLKVFKPSAKQLHIINKHYAHYGYDCIIPEFALEWSKVRDKLNVWGFRYIESINVKSLILRLYIIGKFINGVKLIHPVY